MQNIERPVTPKKEWTLWDSNSGPTGYLPVLRQAASLASHAFGVEPVELKIINSISTDNLSQIYLFCKKSSGRSGIRTQDRPVMSRLLWPLSQASIKRYTIFNFLTISPAHTFRLLVSSAAKPHSWLRAPSALSRLLWPAEVNLSAINCRTFRRTSKQYQNLIPCKQTQNEREGHSRDYPHRPIQIWACHTQTVEVHMSRFYYAASQEPELSFFRITLPATAFQYQSLQCAGERTSLLLDLYTIC